MRHAAGELADGLHLLRLDEARLGLDPPRRLGLEFGGALADPLLELLVHVGERGHRCFQLGLAFGERRFRELPFGDVDIDAAIAHRIAGKIADHPPPPEDPAGLAIARADDAVLRFLPIGAAFHRLAIAGNDPVSVVRVTKIARGRDRHGFVRRRQAHQAEELRRAAQHAGGKLDVPDADAGGALGQAEDLVALAELALHPGALGDVAKEDGEPRRTRLQIELDRSAGCRGYRLDADALAARHGALVRPVRFGPGKLREHGQHVAAEKRLAPLAPEALRAGIHIEKTPVAVDGIEGLVHAFEDFDRGRQRLGFFRHLSSSGGARGILSQARAQE